jgi:hypothetical protein
LIERAPKKITTQVNLEQANWYLGISRKDDIPASHGYPWAHVEMGLLNQLEHLGNIRNLVARHGNVTIRVKAVIMV